MGVCTVRLHCGTQQWSYWVHFTLWLSVKNGSGVWTMVRIDLHEDTDSSQIMLCSSLLCTCVMYWVNALICLRCVIRASSAVLMILASWYWSRTCSLGLEGCCQCFCHFDGLLLQNRLLALWQISTDLDKISHTPILVRNTLVGRLRPRSARGRLQAKPERLYVFFV